MVYLLCEKLLPQHGWLFDEPTPGRVVEIPLAPQVFGSVGVGIEGAHIRLGGYESDVVAIERNQARLVAGMDGC